MFVGLRGGVVVAAFAGGEREAFEAIDFGVVFAGLAAGLAAAVVFLERAEPEFVAAPADVALRTD